MADDTGLKVLLEDFKSPSDPKSSPVARLQKCQNFVADADKLIKKDDKKTTPEVTHDLVKQLILHCLSGPKSEALHSFLLGQRVQGLTSHLHPNDVIRGMTSAADDTEISLQDFINFGGKLVKHWFDDERLQTEAGFVTSLFKFMTSCYDRQRKSHDHSRCSPATLDDALDPVIRKCVRAESGESINAVCTSSSASLHVAAALLLPKVTRTLLAHSSINVNAQNASGNTPLAVVVWEDAQLTDVQRELWEILLERDDLEIGVCIKEEETAVDLCLDHVHKEGSETQVVLDMIKAALRHPSLTRELVETVFAELLASPPHEEELAGLCVDVVKQAIHHPHFTVAAPSPVYEDRHPVTYCLEKLAASTTGDNNHALFLHVLDHLAQHDTCDQPTYELLFREMLAFYGAENPADASLKSFSTRILLSIVQNAKFDVNATLNDARQTAAHVCAITPNVRVLEALIRSRRFEANRRDAEGKPPLFHIVENCQVTDAIHLVKLGAGRWNLEVADSRDRRVLDFYEALPNKSMHVSATLYSLTTGQHVMAPAACRENHESAVNLPDRNITLVAYTRPESATLIRQIKVMPATEQFYQEKYPRIRRELVYDLNRAAKGKMLIISLTEFVIQWLGPLDGYREDVRRLAYMWQKLGFSVFVPKWEEGHGNYCLTANEIEDAVERFADKLETTDQCAVLAILTHGGEGFVYGSDGKPVYLKQLLRCLDNINCIQMAGKPKIVIVQACQGDSFDSGVHVRAGPSTEFVPAAGGRLLPVISDMLICYAAMSGYASFVKLIGDRGSVYIKTLIHQLAEHGHCEDIYTILTWVNKQVASEVIETRTPGSSSREYKQMSRFESCLTRQLYLFPCPRGCHGDDWRQPGQGGGEGGRSRVITGSLESLNRI